MRVLALVDLSAGGPLEQLLHQLLPALQTPAGALTFIPLYAIWVTLLLQIGRAHV